MAPESDMPSMVSHLGAVALHRKHEAAAHHGAVEQHRAGAAHALLAADMAAGQAEIVAQEIDQRLARLDALAHVLAIHAQTDLTEALAHGDFLASRRG